MRRQEAFKQGQWRALASWKKNKRKFPVGFRVEFPFPGFRTRETTPGGQRRRSHRILKKKEKMKGLLRNKCGNFDHNALLEYIFMTNLTKSI